MDTKRIGDGSPWGRIESVEKIGTEGIVFVSTPSHGGFYVPKALLSRIPAEKLAKTWSRGQGQQGWFEEDCDAALVIAAFPELFTRHGVAAAATCIQEEMR